MSMRFMSFVVMLVGWWSMTEAQAQLNCIGLGSDDEWLGNLANPQPLKEMILRYNRCVKEEYTHAPGKYICGFERYAGIQEDKDNTFTQDQSGFARPDPKNKYIVGGLKPEKTNFTINIEAIPESTTLNSCINRLDAKGLTKSDAIEVVKSCSLNFKLSTNLMDLFFVAAETPLEFHERGGMSVFKLYQDNSFLFYFNFFKTQHVGQGQCRKVLKN